MYVITAELYAGAIISCNSKLQYVNADSMQSMNGFLKEGRLKYEQKQYGQTYTCTHSDKHAYWRSGIFHF